MITIRRAADRGHADHGWLNTYHTFSFAGYQDPQHMRFRALRVMNEDVVQPGSGFGTHPHHDMEIVTYILSGQLEHRDSMGNGSIIHAGEFQRMTAGTGITHSEFNPSDREPVHLYQIWLLPRTKGLEPSYEQRQFTDEMQSRLRLVASSDGRDDSLTINQDASIYLSRLDAGESIQHALMPNRHAWLQVLRGSIDLNGQSLATSDGAAVSEEPALSMAATEKPAEIMLFDLS